MNVNKEGVESAGKNNHVRDVCADRYKISMHTISFTLAPEVLLGGNLIAAFLSPGNFCRSIEQKERKAKKKKGKRRILQEKGRFHPARPAGIGKADSFYRSSG